VLLDNASQDPLVTRVIQSFEKRDFFHRVHRRTDNCPHALSEALTEYAGELGEYFGFIESDVLVLPTGHCWLRQYMDLMDADPKLGMLGSLIDKSDFIDPAWAATHFPQLTDKQLTFVTKSTSPERTLADSYAEPLIDPFNPPGRLLMLRTDAVRQTGILRDRKLYDRMKVYGFKGAIATGVRHRHLSLANAFDYPEYDAVDRERFFRGVGEPAAKK
jgi:hypothetical protein